MGWMVLTAAQEQRWRAVYDLLVEVLSIGHRRVLVLSDPEGLDQIVADQLADALPSAPTGRATTAAPLDPYRDWDVVIHLRDRGNAVATRPVREDIVVDVSDPGWPVVRHIEAALAPPRPWQRAETQAFFAVRAATWDNRFGDDGPAYARAVAGLDLASGAVAIDVGCGTGRALPPLRAAVGPQGTVIGLDLTEEMLRAAAELGRRGDATLVLGDAAHLPLATGRVDAVFAAGLVSHVPESAPLLGELARVTRPGGRLVLFHPSGRAALAARHRRPLRDDELLAEPVLGPALADSGWSLIAYDDAADRFFALASRRG